MTVRVGIVGAGFAGSLHAQALRQVPGCEVTAVAARDAEHAFVFARTFGIRHAFIDFRDMLTQDLVDAITVACPTDLHAGVALTAAAAGKHVLVEKPLALNLKQCDELIAGCRDKNVVLMYGENLCFAPAYVRAKELVEEGALGRVYYVRQSLGQGAPHEDWYLDVERSGGGALMDLGTRSIGLCRWLLGNARVVSVYAELGRYTLSQRTKGEDQSVVTMRLARGAMAVAESSWARPGGGDDRLEVCGTKGVAQADLYRGPALVTYSEGGYGYPPEHEPPTRGWSHARYEDAWAAGFVQEMSHFIECVREGKRPALTGEDGRAALEAVCAAYESARTGRRVSLPIETEAAKPIDLWLAEGGD